jgi:hypothetical protein
MDFHLRCNQRCAHCKNWRVEESDVHYMTSDKRKLVIDEFSSLAPQGFFVPCGGESTLNPEGLFDLTKHARGRGLRVLITSNGTQVTSPADAERLLTEGPHEISISFDDWRPKHHDLQRGTRGAFSCAKRAVELLLSARERLRLKESRIHAMGLVTAQNYKSLPAFYRFTLCELGVDKLKLNLAQPSFGKLEGSDAWFAQMGAVDPELFERTIQACADEFQLPLNPAWLLAAKSYWRSVSDPKTRRNGWAGVITTDAAICNGFERNLHVDRFGVMRLCWGLHLPSSPWLEPGDLTRFWAETDRTKHSICRKACGISHSVRKEKFSCSSND